MIRTLDEIKEQARYVHGTTSDSKVETLAELIAELAHHISATSAQRAIPENTDPFWDPIHRGIES